MMSTHGKHIVCLTGTVFNGSPFSAPRHVLEREGYKRPFWFTSFDPINDATYEKISEGRYHLEKMKDGILADIPFGNGHVGIFNQRFEQAIEASQKGALIVAPPPIAVQVLDKLPQTQVFAFKAPGMELTADCDQIDHLPQFHRIDINFADGGAWSHAVDEIRRVLDQ